MSSRPGTATELSVRLQTHQHSLTRSPLDSLMDSVSLSGLGVLHVGGAFSEQHWILYVLPVKQSLLGRKLQKAYVFLLRVTLIDQGDATQGKQTAGRFSQITACVIGRGARQSRECVCVRAHFSSTLSTFQL